MLTDVDYVQPARNAIVRPVLSERSAAHRPVDAGLRSPITARRSFVALRALVLLVAGLSFPLVMDNHGLDIDGLVIGLGLSIAAILQPVIVRTIRHDWIVRWQTLTDIHVAVLILAFEPAFLPLAALWMGASLTWLSIATTRNASIVIGGLTVVELGALGVIRSAGDVVVVAAGLGMTLALVLMIAQTLRQEMWAAESALVDALAAAGAVVHHSNLDDGTVTRIEGDLHGITGWTAEEWYSASHRDFIHPEDVEQYWVDVDTIQQNTVVDRVARVRRPDGSWVWLRDIARISIDPDGRRSLRGFSLDVTELETATRTLATQARVDLLTGLANRWALTERISYFAESGEPFALLILDLDRFKEVNDTLGHEAGDHLLEVIALRLRQVVSDPDNLARLGGDEFAMLVPNVSCEADLAELLTELVGVGRRPLTVRDTRIAVSASVGVALSAKSGSDSATMLRHADIAMYDAKRQSLPHRVFDDSLEYSSTMQLSLSAALPDAIASGQLMLHFQPKFDITTRRIVGAEGLARWNHPEFGLLTPAAFLDITLVSESGFDFAVSTIEHTAAMIARLREGGFDIPIAANVALGALRTLDFADRVFEILDRHRVPHDRLIIELTESDIQLPSTNMMEALSRLAESGVDVSIDDFGTGHSSLERLRTLRVDELKIDRSFVMGMVDNVVEREIVRSIIALAHSLGYRLVAEGVETEAEATALVDMGCPMAQGYLLSRPLPADDFLATVAANAANAANAGNGGNGGNGEDTEPAGSLVSSRR